MAIHKKIESFIKKDEIWRRILFFMFVFLTVFWFISLILFFCTRIHTRNESSQTSLSFWIRLSNAMVSPFASFRTPFTHSEGLLLMPSFASSFSISYSSRFVLQLALAHNICHKRMCKQANCRKKRIFEERIENEEEKMSSG